MALINCEECKKEVSDKAASCPNCGAPLQVTTEKQSLWDSISQRSGPKEVVVRGTDVGYEAQKATEGLLMIVMGLFLHPVFSFVGFWLICTGLLLILGHVLGTMIGLDMNSPPTWFFISGLAISGILTWLLRARVPKLMKWLFFLLVGAMVLFIVAAIIAGIMEGSASN